jgi:tetratricopeptide (TPR) repeat protein
MRACGLSTAVIVGSLAAAVVSVSAGVRGGAFGEHGNTHHGDAEFTEAHGEGRVCAAVVPYPSVRLRDLRDSVVGIGSVFSATSGSAASGARRDLTGIDALVRVYDYILDARFDQADAELQRACGPAPPEACAVLDATATWWRILMDPDSRALDGEFSSSVDEAIASAEAWVARDPRSAEAQFYLGAAYAVRVQWRVLRAEKLAAARDGKRIKVALDRAIALDPDMDDAYFGVGMYQYYADVAPASAKVLRFLLMLPGGNRTEGLARMLRARAHGRLLQGEADYQLQIIYLWYEHRVDQAVAILESLHDRFPGNPLFLSELAQVQDVYQHDITASLDTWRSELALAREQRLNESGIAEIRARLGVARHLDTLYQTDEAIEQLRAVIDARPSQPYGSLASAWMALGEAEDRLGDRDAALTAYRAAMATAPSPDAHNIRQHAGERIRHAPDPARAEAYRLSLDGFRSLERSNIASAETALTRSIALDPLDPVAHYRYGRVLQARRQDAAALAQFELTIRSARECPAPVAAAAYLEAARLHERLGHLDHAIDYYRTASTLFGGGADARVAANRALARLRAQR